MPSLKARCSICQRQFATARSLNTHAEKFGHRFQERDIQFFKAESNVPVDVPVAQRIPEAQKPEYKKFLCGLAELVNSYLNPEVKSKWVKIDLIMAPAGCFKQLMIDLELGNPFAMREARHPAPLKCMSTAVYYNIYDKNSLANLFAQTTMPLKTKAYFRNKEEVSAPPSAVQNLSAREKVLLAKQRAGSRWGTEANLTRQRPGDSCYAARESGPAQESSKLSGGRTSFLRPTMVISDYGTSWNMWN
ncbi:hypothetical protein OS493_038640 [Desmophyllum pertusum]|uniref:C2H2-type domain-containing protein n=1 Tax=Desmophyllum pertusum TaxID=174260 RepID=A0A9X0D818_9CNID|nr:hypothetical protein OS493_038640 [Desmophyllum pertusum]